MVARGGVEPPTFRFSVGRSYQLSYLAGAPSPGAKRVHTIPEGFSASETGGTGVGPALARANAGPTLPRRMLALARTPVRAPIV
jgi:hypothetical protein